MGAIRDFLKVLSQRSVLLLVLPALAVLLFVDPALALTLIQWSAFALVLAGVSIMISMITFPQIKLTDFVEAARVGNLPAAIVAAAIIIFFGVLFYSMIYWAKT